MAITSGSEPEIRIQFKSAQFQYSIVYVIITFIVLLFLNIYCSKVSQQLFYSSKETSMIEKCNLAANEIASLEALNGNTIANAITGFENLNVTRVIVTDEKGQAIYDSIETFSVVDQYVLFPEIIRALAGNDVFYWSYHDGAMQSNAAVPVYSYGTLIGCVYMMEYDAAQGTLIATLQNNILTITFILEIIVILFSFFFSNTYSRRLRKIMESIRTVREGDYSHTVEIGGNDELRSLSNEFNDLIERLQTSENKRSQFVSDASHELKTPLASIKLLSDSILHNEMDSETVKEFVEDIGNEADRLNRMSQKLLTLSKIDYQSEDCVEISYIAPTVERVARMLSENAKSNEISVILDIEQDCPIRILEDDLYQIIFNLVENGIKYNIRGGQLLISLQHKNDDVVIRIEDTGVGIPQEALSHIFERFYRVDKARSRSTGGSGLGLSIVRNMVERNGGKIKVESSVGKGTAFYLTFPVYSGEEDSK